MQKKSKKGKIDKNICQMHYKRNHKLFDTLSSKFGKPFTPDDDMSWPCCPTSVY